ncbi:MAG: S9 family peptidase [Spirochaetales bacterium]
MNTTPLIPRRLIFGNPERTSLRVSPDGRRLAWLAPRDGVLNVWVAPRDDLEAAKPVTHDATRGIRFFAWAFTSNHILHIQDKGGDENWRLYATDLVTGDTRDLTPFENVQARIEQLSPRYPTELLVGLNNRDPQWHDVHRLDLTTGTMELVFENNEFAGVLADERFDLREAYAMTADGGFAVFRPRETESTGASIEWVQVDAISAEDSLTTDSIGFDESGRTLYLRDSRGRDTSALYAVDYETGDRRLLAEDARADAGEVVRHPVSRTVQAVSFVSERSEWRILDDSIAEHLERLEGASRGEVQIVSRSQDDRYWAVAYEVDDGPVAYYLYDTTERAATKLFTSRPGLEDQPLARMHSATIQTRDGLDMVVYWTLPVGTDTDEDGIPDAPLPFVLHPHGGPWARDYWGYDAIHQWLANRGYAVMSLNFRSSTGFGKAFTNAGDREWGGKIIEDQIHAVEWAKAKGIADLERVGVMGGSFGGYSVLAGLTFHPDVYACGVDIVGPSNLITFIESIPEYWKPMIETLASRVGDHRTDEGRELLERHSPLNYVERIRTPLLIGQGANDPRVKQAESDQIAAAMQEKGIPVSYVLYPDEGHGFARPENRLSFFAIAEAFLAQHLGGRTEPVGDDFTNSSVRVTVGAADIPGVSEALS